jgi:hypothetical protein
MFDLLVSKDWFKDRWETEPRKRKHGRLPKYAARFLVCVLLIVGSVVLASEVSGGRSGYLPRTTAGIRLM